MPRLDLIGLVVNDMAGSLAFLAPFDAFWGQHYATVLNPEDNPVDLFAPSA